MPYSCDPLSRDLDGKSITTEFLFPYLRYFEFMCAKRLRGRLYFVIRLSKIQIKVAHANFFIYLYRYWLLDLVLSYPSKMVILREKQNISGKYRSSCRCRSRPQKPLPLDFWTASFSELTFQWVKSKQKRVKTKPMTNKPVAHMSLSKNVQSVGDTSWDNTASWWRRIYWLFFLAPI